MATKRKERREEIRIGKRRYLSPRVLTYNVAVKKKAAKLDKF
jgi:hypothetical protein